MPDTRIIKNTPALAAQVDASSVAGQNLFTRVNDIGAVNTATLAVDAGIFWDLPAFLHGYGSKPGNSLVNLMQAAWGGPGHIKIYIGTNDLVRIISTDTPIALEAGASNEFFGFNPAGQFSVIEDGKYVIEAVQPWRRGVIELPAALELTDTDSGVIYTVIGDFPRVQSLPTWMRERGSMDDSDDVWLGKTVEDADPQALATWLVEPDGRVSVSYYEEGGFLLGNNAEFWRMLGGTLEETPVDGVGGRKTLTTANRAPSFLALDFPYISMRRTITGRDEHQMMSDGRVVSSGLPPVRGWNLKFRVSGPTYGPERDQERHLRAWWDYARRNVTFYPQWGDMDRPEGSIDVRRHTDALIALSHERYGDGFTVEAEDTTRHFGKRKGGRLMMRRAPDDSQSRTESYDMDIDIFQDVEMVLLDRVGV